MDEQRLQDTLNAMASRLTAIETDLALIRKHGLPTCPAHGFMIEDHIARLAALDKTTAALHDLMLRLENIASNNQTRISALEGRVTKLEVAEGRRGLIVLSLSTIGGAIGIGVGLAMKLAFHRGTP